RWCPGTAVLAAARRRVLLGFRDRRVLPRRLAAGLALVARVRRCEERDRRPRTSHAAAAPRAAAPRALPVGARGVHRVYFLRTAPVVPVQPQDSLDGRRLRGHI